MAAKKRKSQRSSARAKRATASASRSTLGLAAANGLTPAVAKSWFPPLVRTPRLLVPIELSVLMVRDSTESWAKCGMQTPTAHGPASALLPPPFTDLDAPRDRGAYLQWYLPNGLTAGTSDAASNTASFPAIPDRWLVLRTSGSGTSRRAVRGWVLEANAEPPVVTDLAAWTEPGIPPAVINPLTALGHGDLAWAGYFDNVVNRLGFHDDTLDVDKIQGTVSYTVCGWYAEPTLDPLGSQTINSPAAFNTVMRGLGWGLDTTALADVVDRAEAYIATAAQIGLATIDAPTIAATGAFPVKKKWWPSACVLHGSVVGISWPDASDTVEVGGPPDPTSITVAIGNTMGETLGTLVARANDAPDEAAIVEALQLGVIKDLDAPDGRAQLDTQLHASSFIAQSGGDPTTETITIAPSGPPPAPIQTPVRGHPVLPVLPVAGTLAEMTVPHGTARTIRGETAIIAGGLREAINTLGGGPVVPPTDPGGQVDALRAPPRLYLPKDPMLLVQGGKRAFVHDSSVFTEDGIVQCRLTTVTAVSWTVPKLAGRLSVTGGDILAGSVNNGSVPLECQSLLEETALLDPGAAPVIVAAAGAVPASATSVAQRNVAVEQTAWYALRNPHFDYAPLLAHSGLTGMLPAPFAVAPAARPWTPLHLDWSVEFTPSPGGVADWHLGEIDFALGPNATVPAAGNGIVLTGRSTVTGGASATLSSAVVNALTQAASISGTGPVIPAVQEMFYSPLAEQLTTRFQTLTLGPATGATPLTDIATALSQMDVLSCGLDGLLTQIRGTDLVRAVRAGVLRIVRLRLVDGFGQYVNLCGSDATHTAQGIVISAPLAIADTPDVAALPPRFTAPTRATLRFMSADQPNVEADPTTSPVCGFLMPNHLDGSLEFFNGDGSNAGTLQPRPDERVIWQDAPGTPTTAGQNPEGVLTNAYAAKLARSLIDWGVADASESREPAFKALLRTIDSTRWSIDPFAHAGDEHLSLLLGHPVCVLRALLRLDVTDPVATPDSTVLAVPVRLGALAQWQDGLLGYFANDDYTRLYVSDAAASMARLVGRGQGFLQPINAVPQYYETFADDLPAGATAGATPVSHPYIDTTGTLWIRPNQTVDLTLLVEPLTSIHVTAGLVPRKEVGMRRAWVQDGLAAIAPTFLFGPVLVDPQTIRMPLATDINGTWVWDYRSTSTTWTEDPATNATDDALLSRDPPTAIEGWLRLSPSSPTSSTTP